MNIRRSILSAALGGLLASASWGGFTVSHDVVSVDTTLDRINLYALNTGGGTGTGLIAVELSVNANPGSLAYFRSTSSGSPNVTNTAETPLRSFVRIDNEDASTTSLVQRTPAGIWPLTPALGANTVGIEDFTATIASLAGPRPANLGIGVLFASLYVSKGYSGQISGYLGGEMGTKVPFVVGSPPPPPPTLVISSVTNATVDFGPIVSTPMPYSASVGVTTSDPGALLSLSIGTLPAGVTASISGGGTSPASFTISGTVDYPGTNTTVLVPIIASDGFSTTAGTYAITITPEPGTLAAFGCTWVLVRRRRSAEDR